MECNKDEAFRAKEIAEKKFMGRDYAGAKKFALKAQSLYPELEGLSQMLTAFDVYISAENRISSGEVDWYCVLGVKAWADDETVRKQYHKLALMLHPDKNKCVGADGAFKLVSEAWGLLCDKEKRQAYNQKLNPAGQQERVTTQTKVPSAQHKANGFNNHNSTVTSHTRTQNKNMQSRPTSVPSSSQKPDTFWTICNRCMMHYEYLRVYLNHNLLCPNCHQPFLAVEKDPPSNVKKAAQNSRHHAANSNPFNSQRNGGQNSGSEGFGVRNSTNGPNLHRNNFTRMNGAGGKVASTSTIGHADSVVQKAHGQLKREQEDAQATTEWEKRYTSKWVDNSTLKVDQLFKRRRHDETGMNNHGADILNQAAIGNGGAGIRNSSEPRRGQVEAQRVYGFSDIRTKSIAERELSLLELRNMLMKKGLLEVCGKLKEWSSNQVKLKECQTQKSLVNNDANKHKKSGDSAGTSSNGSTKLAAAPLSINVPDPDFHNFDLDRTESSFGDDQVWAAYDENDGMPRYYARIHSVISLKPFKMKISWLNSRSNSEFGLLDWVGSGFLKTCGDFRTGRHEISKTLNSFSHRVTWTKGARGVVRILPRKGDVWALYRDWSPDWNEDTPDEVVQEYEMVEVLDDYDEEQGISVVPLVKVAGFKAVFHRHVGPNEVRRIPKEEMFRFSHQVPNHVLTGKEAHNVPEGCRELDPAAIPLEFLQVITEAREAELVVTDRKADKQTVQSFSQMKAGRMVDDASITKEMIGSEDRARDDLAAIPSELPLVITEVNKAQMESTGGKAKGEMAYISPQMQADLMVEDVSKAKRSGMIGTEESFMS